MSNTVIEVDAAQLLTLVTVLVGVGAAVLGGIASRLLDDRRPSWLAVALVVYCAVLLLYPVAGGVLGAGLRTAGLLVVLLALVRCVRRALAGRRAEQDRLHDELAAAALHRQRAEELAAERDHELRNGLAGLAGITHLISVESSGADHEPLKHAVLAELGRLHTILDGPPAGSAVGDVAPATEYAVEPVLAGLVTLRRSAVGRGRVRLRVDPGLRARGHSPVLAQVVTNLLSNCDRHAPGAPVTVAARAARGAVVVEVRDEGPGLPSGREDAVLDRGFRDESAGGSGLGLHISRTLVAREGGSLVLRSVHGPRGCVAVVTVPAAGTAGSTAATAGRAPSLR